MRGGEKMLSALLDIFPDADIYTHVYNPRVLPPSINRRRVFTSYINKLPFAKKLYQIYMPLMPAALHSFNLQDYDLIISSEAGPAKGVVPSPDAYHICYCHSPARYIWELYHQYYSGASLLRKIFMRLLTGALRVWDVTSANLVDRFITNSTWTAKRIKRYYNRDAEVVFGPADVELYYPIERKGDGGYYLFFGQLTPNKRVDLAIDACILAKKKLIVAGGGEEKIAPRYKKNPLIQFTGKINDEKVKEYFSGAKALLFPGIEDMGLVPIEANAAGCPVIAFRKGGALDTIKEGVTGIFFDEDTPASLAAAILKFESIEDQLKDRNAYTEWTKQFSRMAFIERIKNVAALRQRV